MGAKSKRDPPFWGKENEGLLILWSYSASGSVIKDSRGNLTHQAALLTVSLCTTTPPDTKLLQQGPLFQKFKAATLVVRVVLI